jgi:NADPH:quinone reductase-like Zn-dependent oxidoreductase
MRQLQIIARRERSDVSQLDTVLEPVLDAEEVLISMVAAPLNPSDFLFVRVSGASGQPSRSALGAEVLTRSGPVMSLNLCRNSTLALQQFV